MNKPKLKMILSEEYEQILWNMSLRGGMEWNETSTKGQRLTFNDYFDSIRPKTLETSPRLVLEINFNGINIELFGTNHIPEDAESQSQAFMTFGLFVDNRILFSGDTKFDSLLFDRYSNKSEYIFHDSSFLPNPVHASIQELRTLPIEVKNKLFLMHYGDNWKEQDITGFAGLAKQGYKYCFK